MPGAFVVSVHLLQYGNISRQVTVERTGSAAVSLGGIVSFSNLTLNLAGHDFSLRFQLLSHDGMPWQTIAPILSYPAFRVLPGAPYVLMLKLDRQPGGAVMTGALASYPIVSVRDRGGNKVPEGSSFIFAALIPPASADMDAALTPFNLSLPNLSPSLPPAPARWEQWLDPAESPVLLDSSGTAYFEGLRVFGAHAARGLKSAFSTVWKVIELCAPKHSR